MSRTDGKVMGDFTYCADSGGSPEDNLKPCPLAGACRRNMFRSQFGTTFNCMSLAYFNALRNGGECKYYLPEVATDEY